MGATGIVVEVEASTELAAMVAKERSTCVFVVIGKGDDLDDTVDDGTEIVELDEVSEAPADGVVISGTLSF